jgi:DNA-binding NarL/FixJ family response regulator
MRTIIADPDPLARTVLRDTLRRAGITVVAAVASGLEAVELASHYRPDVVVLGDRGLEAVRAMPREVRVIVLTLSEDPDHAFAALRAGAAGCLAKTIDPDALPRAIRGVCAGEAAISRELTLALVERCRAVPEGTGLRPVNSRLSDREWQVLDRLASGGSPADIADELVLSRETVRTHVKNVYRKLEVNSREAALAAAARLRAAAGIAA